MSSLPEAVEAAFGLVGYPVKDVVTRTQGVCVAVSFGLYGDIRASVCTPDRAQHWFEIKRLVKTGKSRVLQPPEFFPFGEHIA